MLLKLNWLEGCLDQIVSNLLSFFVSVYLAIQNPSYPVDPIPEDSYLEQNLSINSQESIEPEYFQVQNTEQEYLAENETLSQDDLEDNQELKEIQEHLEEKVQQELHSMVLELKKGNQELQNVIIEIKEGQQQLQNVIVEMRERQQQLQDLILELRGELGKVEGNTVEAEEGLSDIEESEQEYVADVEEDDSESEQEYVADVEEDDSESESDIEKAQELEEFKEELLQEDPFLQLQENSIESEERPSQTEEPEQQDDIADAEELPEKLIVAAESEPNPQDGNDALPEEQPTKYPFQDDIFVPPYTPPDSDDDSNSSGPFDITDLDPVPDEDAYASEVIELTLENCYLMNFYLETVVGSGLGYTNGFATLGLFLPVYNNPTSTFQPFVEARTNVFSGAVSSNIGTGFRYWTPYTRNIFGFNLFYDFFHRIHNFHQVGVGLEFSNRYFDFNVNSYIPMDTRSNSKLLIQYDYPGGYFIRRSSVHRSMAGGDINIGTSLNRFVNSSVMDFYASAGPYYYCFKSAEKTFGGRLRVGLQYREFVNFEVMGSYDPLFKANVQGLLKLTLPLYHVRSSSRNTCMPNDFSRRLNRPVLRNPIIVLQDVPDCWTANYEDEEGFCPTCH
jgi:hypothetical protein